jgi:hypothetical protein
MDYGDGFHILGSALPSWLDPELSFAMTCSYQNILDSTKLC